MSYNDISNMSELIHPDQTIFYAIERAIKLYRRNAQAKLKAIQLDITIDQLLVLSKIDQNPEISHAELSELIFKDMASISRILALLEKKEYINREIDPANKRRFKTKVKTKGKDILIQLAPQVMENRTQALQDLSKDEIQTCINILNQISNNIME